MANQSISSSTGLNGMFIFDRLYGQIRFPPILQEALDCPGLMRLREVRMANIPFFSFPSFAAVTRYEHSLGVCYLAGKFAEAVGLSEKDKIELMLAGLYHDVATPPFAHAMEEVLHELFGFDHERKLHDLIIGKTDDLGGHRTQLFLGRALKLHKICQSSKGRKLNLDVYRIAALTAGSETDVMGDLICSNDIDFDNIDNVVRAASAMGIRDFDPNMCTALSKSFIIDGSKFNISQPALSYVRMWQRLRETLYGMIFASLLDFSFQSMLKDAVRRLYRSHALERLNESDWCLTDDQLIHQRLLLYSPSAHIINRMRLGKPYVCLAWLLLEGNDLPVRIPKSLDSIESVAQEVFADYKDRILTPKTGKFSSPQVVVNFYLDKRKRLIRRSFLFQKQRRQMEDQIPPTKAVLGVFTPHYRGWDETALKSFVQLLSGRLPGVTIKKIQVTPGKYPDIQAEEVV